MEELIRGLRGELIDCRCCAHSRSECCCDCTWPEDVARQAADMLETQAAKIQQMALEYISEQGPWIDEIGRLRSKVENLKLTLEGCRREFGDIINHAHKDYLVRDWAREAILRIDKALELK